MEDNDKRGWVGGWRRGMSGWVEERDEWVGGGQ